MSIFIVVTGNKISWEFGQVYPKYGSLDSSAGVASMLQDEILMNRCYYTGRIKGFTFSQKSQDQLWDPASFLLNGYQGFSIRK